MRLQEVSEGHASQPQDDEGTSAVEEEWTLSPAGSASVSRKNSKLSPTGLSRRSSKRSTSKLSEVCTLRFLCRQRSAH